MFVAFPIHGVLWPQSMATVIQTIVRGGTLRMEGSAWLDQVRSELVGQFLETREQQLLFIDADNWFETSTVDTMIAAEADIITASYRKRLPPHQFVAVPIGGHPKKSPIRMVNGARVIEIERDGLGCCLIQRRVIEALYEKHPELEYSNDAGRPRRNLFEYGVFTDQNGVRRAGQEDRAFFKRVRDAGFKVECLVDATIVHGGVPGRFGDVLDEP
jgi:hypothetical protein